MVDPEFNAPALDEALPRRRLGLRILLGGTVVLVIGAAGAAYALRDGEKPTATSNATLPTATVKRIDMSNATEVDGTLGYEGSYTVLGAGSGKITWLPSVGQVIKRGQPAYGVDGHSVPLFYGSTPFWRVLNSGISDGDDVLELESNLKALGYGSGLSVDRKFTSATVSAIKKWQADLGLGKTGSMSPTDVVLQPGPIRVAALSAILGGPAEGTMFTASGTERRVTVTLQVVQQEIAKNGAKVRVKLPGGKSTTGRIASIGTTATAGKTNSQSQTGQGTETATITVSITLDNAEDAGNLDAAPVTVGFISSEHKGVLSVPINALLAAADGSYSVNVVDETGNVTSVPVELGIFDGDNVEISGNLAEGAKVQVPRS